MSETAEKLKILICTGTGGLASGAADVVSAFEEEFEKKGVAAQIGSACDVSSTGCRGLCANDVLVDVCIPGKDPVTYDFVTADLVPQIVRTGTCGGLGAGRPPEDCGGGRLVSSQHLDLVDVDMGWPGYRPGNAIRHIIRRQRSQALVDACRRLDIALEPHQAEFRLDQAGIDLGHPQRSPEHFLAQHLAERAYGKLGSVVASAPNIGIRGGHGTDHDNVTVAAGEQLGKQSPDHAKRPEDVHVVHLAPTLVLSLGNGVEPQRSPGVVDEHITGLDSATELSDRGRVGYIEVERHGAGLGGNCFQAVEAPGSHDHGESFSNQAACSGGTDTGARAGNDCGTTWFAHASGYSRGGDTGSLRRPMRQAFQTSPNGSTTPVG